MRWTPLLLLALACGDADAARRPPDPIGGRLSLGSRCVTLEVAAPGGAPRWLARAGEGYAFVTDPGAAAPIHLRAADLGTYLLYDADGGYLLGREDGVVERAETLLSDVLLIDDDFLSPAEWDLEEATEDPGRFVLRHRRSGATLGTAGLQGSGPPSTVGLFAAEGCATFPEMSLDAEVDAEGVRTARFDDGSVYGFVETHAHLLTNFAFGGGGLFHGAPFHRLGVEHALPDCSLYHGDEGRQDILGFTFDASGADVDATTLLTSLVAGSLPEPAHATDGWPTFTDWPNAPGSSTHQAQYWRWLERAYLGGLRLLVQHATSNQVLCDLVVGSGIQEVRYGCEDMVAVDRILEETYNLERYIDAQYGGPGEGFFRIVRTPDEARRVIDDGKMAVVLGIEVSNLFECRLTPEPGQARCDDARMRAELDRYRDLGVRAIFPIHKYDNAFGSGDGDRDIIEIGNLVNSGHFSNYVETCPDIEINFDRGGLGFGGLNMPRDDFLAAAPNDFSAFAEDPVAALTPFLSAVTSGPLEGDFCLNAGMTELGMNLVEAMMDRGMILEIDHLGRQSYAEVFARLEEVGYPAAGTHGINQRGRLYALGGVSKTDFADCADPASPGAIIAPIVARAAQREAAGQLGAEGFGFDFNGFSSYRPPRFGPDSRCGPGQANPTRYPFRSHDGRVTFTAPSVGERALDFDTEGFVHLGLLPEIIDDARRDGATEEDFEALFKSAEAYLQMWERAERIAGERRGR